MFEREHIPIDHELPLNIQTSEKVAESGESTVWKSAVKSVEKQEKLIALKQVRREEFGSMEGMIASKKFYDFLKQFPKFSKAVPDTLYFIAKMSAEHKAQGFYLQPYAEGKVINQLSDEELYKDPEVVRQLHEFALGAAKLLESTRKQKMHKPDFGVSYDSDWKSRFYGNT